MSTALRLVLVVLLTVWAAAPSRAAEPLVPFAATAQERQAYEKAAAYSTEHGGVALAILRGGRLAFEAYARGDANTPHSLHSGTKSFWCAAAASAVADGLFTLDEPVAATIGEWKDDPRKALVTVRQLLGFTSGLPAGVRQLRGASGDNFAKAIALDIEHEPGSTFVYGPSHLTVFGAFLKRRLNEDPVAFLERRVFAPIGLSVASWRRDAAGNPTMAAGAALTAREWAKFGQYLLASPDVVARCAQSGAANPAYGLTLWLNDQPGHSPRDMRKRKPPSRLAPNAPRDMLVAGGAGNQRLYVLPSQGMVIVRLAGRGTGWKDDEFLKLVLEP
ncbi:MAG: beta-lactamase family protein [Alphaproteobacteria bacterium]|nr:beta-lactamase family protein [Alphaproteobacteria bacterium]